MVMIAGWLGSMPVVRAGETAEIGWPQVLEAARARHPELRAADAAVSAQEGALQQSRSRPNPELGLTVENVAGSGGYGGARQAESTLELRQPLELGGKRDARTKAATLSLERSRRERDFKAVEIEIDARRAFIEALAAQSLHEEAGKARQLAEDVRNTVREKVDAGKVSPVELLKANAAMSDATSVSDKAGERWNAARSSLAVWLGSAAAPFARVKGTLVWDRTSLSLENLLQDIPQSPSVAGALGAADEYAALARVEERRRIPDVTVGAGYRHLSGTEDHALVFSLSLPLPVSNRNRGAMKSAQSRAEESVALREAAERRVRQRVHELWGQLSAAQSEATRLHSESLPAWEQAFAATLEGYRSGKFTYLDTLEAQRSLLRAREQWIESTAQAWRSWLSLAQLLGKNPDVTAVLSKTF